MKNSVETILQDIKKLFKELESAYGEVQPYVCKVDNAFDKCPNTKCWVQKIRDEQSDRIFEMERVILEAINIITMVNQTKANPAAIEILEPLVKKLDLLINPTPCRDCSEFDTCNKSYKAAIIHDSPCVGFSNKTKKTEDSSKVAIHF